MTDTVDDSQQKVTPTNDSFSDPLRSNQKEWVKFDDESSDQNGINATTKIDIPTQGAKSSVTSEKNTNNKVESSPAIIEVPSTQISQLSTIDLPPRRDQEGFGKKI